MLLSTNPTLGARAELKTRPSIHVGVRSCRHVRKLGETFSWTGRETCPGWRGFRGRVLHRWFLLRRKQCLYNRGGRTRNRNHHVSSGQASWKMVGNNPVCRCSVRPWSDLRPNDRVAKSIVFYPGVLTRLIWNGFGQCFDFPCHACCSVHGVHGWFICC